MVYGLWFMVYGLWFMASTPLPDGGRDALYFPVQAQSHDFYLQANGRRFWPLRLLVFEIPLYQRFSKDKDSFTGINMAAMFWYEYVRVSGDGGDLVDGCITQL